MYQVPSTFKTLIAEAVKIRDCLPLRLGVFARENQGIPTAPLAIQDAGTQAIHHYIPINYFWTSILFLNENNQLVIN